MKEDPFQSAMRVAHSNMVEADRLSATGRAEAGRQLANSTMQVVLMMGFNEALFQALHGQPAAKAAPAPAKANFAWRKVFSDILQESIAKRYRKAKQVPENCG